MRISICSCVHAEYTAGKDVMILAPAWILSSSCRLHDLLLLVVVLMVLAGLEKLTYRQCLLSCRISPICSWMKSTRTFPIDETESSCSWRKCGDCASSSGSRRAFPPSVCHVHAWSQECCVASTLRACLSCRISRQIKAKQSQTRIDE